LENLYHVLLGGRRVGPYDRRTIVGMRVKKALKSDNVVVAADGSEMTVAELVRQDEASSEPFEASGGSSSTLGTITVGGSHSVIQALHTATLLEVEGKGYEVPAFKGEVEVRVQTKALRLAGRFRSGAGWKEDRVKFPLQDIAHARLRGTVVDLWVRHGSAPGLQRVALDLHTPDAAGELAEGLSHAAPWPGSEPLAARAAAGRAIHPMMWGALAGTALLVGGVLVWLLARYQ
jgi:hypothetical protein